MASRLRAPLRTGLRQLSTATRSKTAPRSYTWGYAAGTVLLGTTLAISIEVPRFQNSFLVHAEVSANPEKPARDDREGSRHTSIMHPVTLPLNAPTASMTLVGLGVRTVSFLSVRVYSAGFYIEEEMIKSLHHIPGWNNYTSSLLLNPPTKSNVDTPQLTGEALVANLLDTGAKCAIRIVPVRNTDFSHLRDGFTRAVQARQKLARAAKQLTEEDEVRIGESLQQLKSLFPAQSVPKGKALVLLRTPKGLTVEYEGTPLGTVNDSWVAKELMMAYFADKDVISSKLKQDVASGFEGLMKPHHPTNVGDWS